MTNLSALHKIDGLLLFDKTMESVGRIRSHATQGRAPVDEYAIVSLGGRLGVGEDCRPIPLSSLCFDDELAAFRTVLTKDEVLAAPIFTCDGNWSEPDWINRVRRHYHVSATLN